MSLTLVGASNTVVYSRPNYRNYGLAISFGDNGSKWYEIYGSYNSVYSLYQFTLSTPYDLSTRSWEATLAVSNPQQFRFSEDGSKLIYIDYGRILRSFDLGTPWDISTASNPQQSADQISEGYGTKGIAFNPDGTILIMSRTVDDIFHEYTMSPGFDVTSLTYSGVSKTGSSLGLSGVDQIYMLNDGQNLLVTDNDNKKVWQLDLATAWDISTAANSGTSFSVATYRAGICVDEINYGLYLQDSSTPHNIYQYDLVWIAPPAPEVPPDGVGFFFGIYGDPIVTIPISNVSARIRSGAPSYLQVTIPYTAAAAVAITDRQDEDIELIYQSVDGIKTTVLTVALETIQISRGTQSSSIVLTGHRQTTNGAPGSHIVIPLSMQTGTTANTVIIPGYDPTILPADEITSLGSTFTAETVSLQASASYIQTQLIGSA